MSAVLDFKAKCEHGWEGSPSRCGKCRSEARKASRVEIPDGRKKVIATEHGRNCLKCGEIKSWNEFAKDIHGFNQKTADCLDCRNAKSRQAYQDNPAVRRSGIKNRPDKLKRLYGITYEDVLAAYKRQEGKCANETCRHPILLDVKGVTKDRACIDHDHDTGAFRELLCAPCNSFLGTIETKENIILGLVAYRDKHKGTYQK